MSLGDIANPDLILGEGGDILDPLQNIPEQLEQLNLQLENIDLNMGDDERKYFTKLQVRFDAASKYRASTWTHFQSCVRQQLKLTYGLNVVEQKYLIVAGLGEKEQRLAAHVITTTNLDAVAGEFASVEQFLKKLTEIFRPKNFAIISRQRFKEARQFPTDTIMVYACRLKALFEEAYPDALNVDELKELLREQFVKGLLNRQVRISLMNETWQDYDALIEKAASLMAVQTRDRYENPGQYSETKTEILGKGLGYSTYTPVPADLISQLGQRGSSAGASAQQGFAAYQPLLAPGPQIVEPGPQFQGALPPSVPMEVDAIIVAAVDVDSLYQVDAAPEELITLMLTENIATVNAVAAGKKPSCHYCSNTNHFIANCFMRRKHQAAGIFARTSAGASRTEGTRGGRGGFRGGWRGRGAPFSRGSPSTQFNFRGTARGRQTRDQYNMPLIAAVGEAEKTVCFAEEDQFQEAPAIDTGEDEEVPDGQIAHLMKKLEETEDGKQFCYEDVAEDVEESFGELEGASSHFQ